MKTVATFNKAEEAHLLRMRLEDAGIEAFVQGENTVQSSNALGGIRVEVADEDVEAVVELLGGEDGVEPGNAGEALLPPLLEGADSLPRERKSRSWLYVSLVLFLLGVPFLFALFHFHDFLLYVQNEHGGEDLTSKNARIEINNAAADLVNRGLAERRKGDQDGAIADFSSALKLNPEDAYAYMNRAISERGKSDFKSAMADSDKAIQIKPNLAVAYEERGLLKKIMGDVEGAMADYDKAIEIDPNDSFAYQDRGSAKRATGDMDGALADFDKAIQLKPDLDGAYLGRARVQSVKGDLDAAMADCNKAIELSPDHSMAYGYRGDVKKAKGDMDGALADFDKAIQLKPNSMSAYLDKALAQTEKGDFDAAMADCNKAIGLSPADSIPYEYLGNVKKTKGDMDGALADFDKAIELNKSRTGDVFYNRGCLLFDTRKLSGALVDFRKASSVGLANVLANDYTHYRIYLVRALLGENAAAASELQTYMSNRKAGQGEDWPLKVGLFLDGQLPEVDFINAATDTNATKSREKNCEAWFYAGMKHLIASDKVTAQDDFKKCIATGRTMDYEYASAAASLKFLEGQ